MPQPYVHHSRGEALFPRASGRRLHVAPSIVLRGPSLPVVYLGSPSQSPLGCFLHHDVLRLLQPSLHALTRCLVVSGHHSTNSALC